MKARRAFLNDCQYVKTLNTTALKELNSLYPHFTLQQLDCWKVPTDKYTYWKSDDLLTPNSSFLNYSDFQFNFSEFSDEKDKKDNLWLWSNKSIYNKPTTKILPGTLEEAENQFDKNVMSIKTLVKEIGKIKELIHKEQKKKLYDDSDIITHTFFTEINEKIPCFGMISLEYDKNDEQLTTPQNALKFDISYETRKENIPLQLENSLNLEKIETVDSKIKNF